MPRVKESAFICFNDGVLDICEVRDRAIVRTKYKRLHFGRQTVGSTRFWTAKAATYQIDAVVAVLPVAGVTTMDLCLLRGQQYKIVQVQDKFDAEPPCLYLSLSREPLLYRDERTEYEDQC